MLDPLTIILGILSLVLGGVSIFVTYRYYQKSDDAFTKLVTGITEGQDGTRDLISDMTGLFAASQKVGIVTAYENRPKALLFSGNMRTQGEDGDRFVNRFISDNKLIVVGSSLLGLKSNVTKIAEIVARRISSNLETKFMLTHPCYSRFRESQERRGGGQIRGEIENMIGLLEGFGLDVEKSIRFYRGTPTCFVIILSDTMLLNPYPYQIEAFSSFCLEVRRVSKRRSPDTELGSTNESVPNPLQVAERFSEDFAKVMADEKEAEYDYRLNVGWDIYGQFYWYHYLLPWFSKQAVSWAEYNEHCRGCDCRETGFKEGGCKLDKWYEEKERQDKSENEGEGGGETESEKGPDEPA